MGGYISTKRVMKMLKLVTMAVVAGGVVLALGCGPRGAATSASPACRKLYLQTVWRPESPARTQDRRRAAAELATTKGSGPWIAWLLTSSDPFMRRERLKVFFDDGIPEDYIMFNFDRAVIAALLEDLPDDTPMPVLLAVTEQLDEERRGEYAHTTRKFFFFVYLGNAGTRPIREIARETLVRITGQDHGFDQDGWRKAILAPAPASDSARLFRQVLPEAAATRDRRGAAEALAKTEGSAPWTVWLLSSSDPFMRAERYNEEVAMFDRAVIASLLDSLPSDAPLAVRLAVTEQLAETGVGRYPIDDESSDVTATGRTLPMREIARDTLKRITGQDHGFDAVKWRKAILHMPRRPDDGPPWLREQ